MFSDNSLIKVTIISALIGFIGLIFVQPVVDEELQEITVLSSKSASEGYFIKFLILDAFSGYSEKNITEGNYLITASPGGNNFYYISSFKKVNGSN